MELQGLIQYTEVCSLALVSIRSDPQFSFLAWMALSIWNGANILSEW